MQLLVVPLFSLERAIRKYRPDRVVSLMSPEEMVEIPPGFRKDRYLLLQMNDVVKAGPGVTAPSATHVDQLLSFSRGWDTLSPLLIHCWAGISRSMAAAFTVFCDRYGAGHEFEIAHAMRSLAPHAMPNRLFVQLADAALDREGRMIAAADAMWHAQTTVRGRITVFPFGDLLANQ